MSWQPRARRQLRIAGSGRSAGDGKPFGDLRRWSLRDPHPPIGIA